ncbi:type VII secretion-associated protein [Gordonia sp. (in: high G+C Gram-positive bacteria)]|uniref:type VII secretion-associated protein n=1 Tax=Gordonia sp. (in: high G+C Gram-positive bacteria) TaxID=84139 RepID=UPI003C74B351
MTTPTIDLAYGHVDDGDRRRDVSALLEDIDSVARRAIARPALAEWVAHAGHIDSVLVPTVWGPVRTASLLAEFTAVGARPKPIPRAVAIAASHAEATAQRCVVVETSLLPTTGGHWSAHAVTRHNGQWELGAGEVTLPQRIPVDPGWARLLETADAVFVDGPHAAVVQEARTLLATSFGVDAVPVERDTLVLHGSRTGVMTGADLLAGLPLPPVPARQRLSRAPAVVVGLLVTATVATAAWVHWPRAIPPDRTTAAVGAAQFEVPGSWRRTDQDAQAGGHRAVFVSPDDGRRLIVVVSRLRAGSTAESVASSLRNRIAQRGDDAVAEFTPDLTYAGRHVIGYRETPVSGAPVAWYVTVEDPLQVSVGCQAGTGEHSVDGPCRATVGSLRVAAG